VLSLLAHAAAAPAVPAAAITGALVLVLVVWVALYGLKYGYDYSLGALLRELADSTRGIRWVGGRIADAIERIDDFVKARIADGISSVEATAALLWDGLTFIVRETGDAIVEFAADIHDTIHALVGAEIPNQVRAGTAPIDTRLDAINRRTNAQARAEAQARARGIDAVNRDLTREALARERGIDYIAGRLNTLVMPRIRSLEQTVADVVGYTRRNLNIRLRTLEKLLAAGALGAIAIAAVTRVFPYWQCSNVRGFNRALCRMPVGLLSTLLSGGLAALVLSDVCTIGRLTRQVAELAQPLMLNVVAVVDAATNCTSFPTPAALPLAATQLPASEALASL